MRLPLCLSALLLGGSLAAAPAHAQLTTLYRNGPWEVVIGRSAQNVPMCAITTSGGNRSFHIKYFLNESVVQVHLFRATWRVPADAQMRLRVAVDNAPAWLANAEAVGSRQTGIGFVVPRASIPEFEALFRAGRTLTIDFPDGDEAPWRVGLSGSNDVMSRFVDCMSVITGNTPAPSQPFARTNPQPFGSASPSGAPMPDLPQRRDGPESAPQPLAARRT